MEKRDLREQLIYLSKYFLRGDNEVVFALEINSFKELLDEKNIDKVADDFLTKSGFSNLILDFPISRVKAVMFIKGKDCNAEKKENKE